MPVANSHVCETHGCFDNDDAALYLAAAQSCEHCMCSGKVSPCRSVALLIAAARVYLALDDAASWHALPDSTADVGPLLQPFKSQASSTVTPGPTQGRHHERSIDMHSRLEQAVLQTIQAMQASAAR